MWPLEGKSILWDKKIARWWDVLRSKGLKDATCVGWFGDDWDCSVGSPPEAMDHVSSAVPVGYAV